MKVVQLRNSTAYELWVSILINMVYKTIAQGTFYNEID